MPGEHLEVLAYSSTSYELPIWMTYAGQLVVCLHAMHCLHWLPGWYEDLCWTIAFVCLHAICIAYIGWLGWYKWPMLDNCFCVPTCNALPTLVAWGDMSDLCWTIGCMPTCKTLPTLVAWGDIWAWRKHCSGEQMFRIFSCFSHVDLKLLLQSQNTNCTLKKSHGMSGHPTFVLPSQTSHLLDLNSV